MSEDDMSFHIKFCDRSLKEAISAVNEAKRKLISSTGQSAGNLTVCSQVPLRKQLSNAIYDCQKKLDKPLWMDRIIQTGDALRDASEFEAANTLCYTLCIKKGYTPGFSSDADLSRDVKAAYGQSLCELELLRDLDPQCKYPHTVSKLVAALGDIQRAMERILTSDNSTTENLYWLIFNGTLHTYALTKHLIQFGFAARAVEFLNYCVLACEAVINLSTVRYLSWRTTLYTAVCTCYSLSGDDQRSLAAANRGLAQAKELLRMENLDPPIPNDIQIQFDASFNRFRLLNSMMSLRVNPQKELDIFKGKTMSILEQIDSFAEALQGSGRVKWGITEFELSNECEKNKSLLAALPRGPRAMDMLPTLNVKAKTLLSLLISCLRYRQAAAFDAILPAAKLACDTNTYDIENILVGVLEKLHKLRLLDSASKAEADSQRKAAKNIKWGDRTSDAGGEEGKGTAGDLLEETNEIEHVEDTTIAESSNPNGGDNDVVVAPAKSSSSMNSAKVSKRKKVVVAEDDIGIQYLDGSQVPEKLLRSLSATLLRISRNPNKGNSLSLYSEILSEALQRIWNPYGKLLLKYLDGLGMQLPPTWVVVVIRDMLLAIHELGTLLDFDGVIFRVVVALRLGKLLTSQNMMMLDLRRAISVLRCALETLRSNRDTVINYKVHHPSKGEDAKSLSWSAISAEFPPEIAASKRLGIGGYAGTGVFGAGSQLYPLRQHVSNLHMELVSLLLHCELRLGQQITVDCAGLKAQKQDATTRENLKAATSSGKGRESTKGGTTTKKSKTVGTTAHDGALIEGDNEAAETSNSVVDKTTENTMVSLCGDNLAWRALLNIRLSEAQPDGVRKTPFFERSVATLIQARNDEEILLKQVNTPVNTKETKVPLAPLFASRTSTSISVRLQKYIPKMQKKNSWDTTVVKVKYFCVYCKEKGTGNDVTLNNTNFKGCGLPISPDQGIVEISCLSPNESYLFSVAAFDEDDKIINGMGNTTPHAITAFHPLPLLLIWGRLCEASRGVCNHISRQSAAVLFKYFVHVKTKRSVWESNPMSDFVLRRDFVKVASLPVIRSLILAVHTLVESNDADNKLIGLLSSESPLPMLKTQINILQMLGQMIIAVDAAVAINDAPLIIESIARSYCIMVQLLKLRKRGRWLLPSLSVCYHAGLRLKPEVTDDASRAVLICIAFEFFVALRAVKEREGLESILKQIPKIHGFVDNNEGGVLVEYRALLDFICAQADCVYMLAIPDSPEPRVKTVQQDIDDPDDSTTDLNQNVSGVTVIDENVNSSEFEHALSSNIWSKLHNDPIKAFQWLQDKFLNDPMAPQLITRIVTAALKKQGGCELYVMSWLDTAPSHIRDYPNPLPLTKLVLEKEDPEAAQELRQKERKRLAAEAARAAAVASSLAAQFAIDKLSSANEAAKLDDITNSDPSNIDDTDAVFDLQEKKDENENKKDNTDRINEDKTSITRETTESNQEVSNNDDDGSSDDDLNASIEYTRCPEKDESSQLLCLSQLSLLRAIRRFRLLTRRDLFKKVGDGPRWDLSEALCNNIETTLPPYERPISVVTVPREIQLRNTEANTKDTDTSNISINETEVEEGDSPGNLSEAAKVTKTANPSKQKKRFGRADLGPGTTTHEEVDMEIVLEEMFECLAKASTRARWGHCWQQLQTSCTYMWNALSYAWISPRDFAMQKPEFYFNDSDMKPAIFDCKYFQIASKNLVDMINLLTIPPGTYTDAMCVDDEVIGEDLSTYDEETSIASSISSRASDSSTGEATTTTGALSEVDIDWVGQFIHFSLKAMYCAKKWIDVVELGECLIGIPIMKKRCAEMVLPVMILAQKQLHKIATTNLNTAKEAIVAFNQREKDRFDNMSSKEKRKRKAHLGGTYMSEADKAAKIEEIQLKSVVDEMNVLAGPTGTGGHLQKLETESSIIARDKSVGEQALASSRLMLRKCLMQLEKGRVDVSLDKSEDVKNVIDKYKQCIFILRQRRKQQLLVQAFNELGDFQFMVSQGVTPAKDETLQPWIDGVDAIFQTFDSMLNWRSLLGAMKEDDVKNNGCGSSVLETIGVFETYIGIILLAKISQNGLANDLHKCLEHVLCAAELAISTFKCSLPNPFRVCDFNSYTTSELFPGQELFSNLERLSPPMLIRSLSYLIQQLLRNERHFKAIPLICMLEHVSSDICREVRTTTRARLLRIEALASLGDISQCFTLLATVSCATCRGKNAQNGSGVQEGAKLPGSFRNTPLYTSLGFQQGADSGNDEDDESSVKHIVDVPQFFNNLPPENAQNTPAIDWICHDDGPPPSLLEIYGRNIAHDVMLCRLQLLIRLCKESSIEEKKDEAENEDDSTESIREKMLNAASRICDTIESSLLRKKSPDVANEKDELDDRENNKLEVDGTEDNEVTLDDTANNKVDDEDESEVEFKNEKDVRSPKVASLKEPIENAAEMGALCQLFIFRSEMAQLRGNIPAAAYYIRKAMQRFKKDSSRFNESAVKLLKKQTMQSKNKGKKTLATGVDMGFGFDPNGKNSDYEDSDVLGLAFWLKCRIKLASILLLQGSGYYNSALEQCTFGLDEAKAHNEAVYIRHLQTLKARVLINQGMLQEASVVFKKLLDQDVERHWSDIAHAKTTVMYADLLIEIAKSEEPKQARVVRSDALAYYSLSERVLEKQLRSYGWRGFTETRPTVLANIYTPGSLLLAKVKLRLAEWLPILLNPVLKKNDNETIRSIDEALERTYEGLQTLRHLTHFPPDMQAELLFRLGRLRRQRSVTIVEVNTKEMSENTPTNTTYQEKYNPGPYSIAGVEYSKCVAPSNGDMAMRSWVRAIPSDLAKVPNLDDESVSFSVATENTDSDIFVAVTALESCLFVSSQLGSHNRRLLFSACMELVTVLGGGSISQRNAASCYLRDASNIAKMLKTLADEVDVLATALDDGGTGLPQRCLRYTLSIVESTIDSAAQKIENDDEATKKSMKKKTSDEMPNSGADAVKALKDITQKSPTIGAVLASSSIYQLMSLRREILLCPLCNDERSILLKNLHTYLKNNCQQYKSKCCVQASPCFTDASDIAHDETGLVRVQWYCTGNDLNNVEMFCVLGVSQENNTVNQDNLENDGTNKGTAKLLKLPMNKKSSLALYEQFSKLAQRLRVASFASSVSGEGRHGGDAKSIAKINSDFDTSIESLATLLSNGKDVDTYNGDKLECNKDLINLLTSLLDQDNGVNAVNPTLCNFLRHYIQP